MQGRLRGEPVEVTIDTECAHCGQPIQMTLDSDLHYRVLTAGAMPLVFEPDVDWEIFTDPNIIHAY